MPLGVQTVGSGSCVLQLCRGPQAASPLCPVHRLFLPVPPTLGPLHPRLLAAAPLSLVSAELRPSLFTSSQGGLSPRGHSCVCSITVLSGGFRRQRTVTRVPRPICMALPPPLSFRLPGDSTQGRCAQVLPGVPVGICAVGAIGGTWGCGEAGGGGRMLGDVCSGKRAVSLQAGCRCKVDYLWLCGGVERDRIGSWCVLGTLVVSGVMLVGAGLLPARAWNGRWAGSRRTPGASG